MMKTNNLLSILMITLLATTQHVNGQSSSPEPTQSLASNSTPASSPPKDPASSATVPPALPSSNTTAEREQISTEATMPPVPVLSPSPASSQAAMDQSTPAAMPQAPVQPPSPASSQAAMDQSTPAAMPQAPVQPLSPASQAAMDQSTPAAITPAPLEQPSPASTSASSSDPDQPTSMPSTMDQSSSTPDSEPPPSDESSSQASSQMPTTTIDPEVVLERMSCCEKNFQNESSNCARLTAIKDHENFLKLIEEGLEAVYHEVQLTCVFPNSKNDNTKCCKDAGAPDDCLEFCAPKEGQKAQERMTQMWDHKCYNYSPAAFTGDRCTPERQLHLAEQERELSTQQGHDLLVTTMMAQLDGDNEMRK